MFQESLFDCMLNKSSKATFWIVICSQEQGSYAIFHLIVESDLYIKCNATVNLVEAYGQS